MTKKITRYLQYEILQVSKHLSSEIINFSFENFLDSSSENFFGEIFQKSNEWWIVSSSNDTSLIQLDTKSGEMIWNYTGHTGPVYSVAASPGGDWIESGSHVYIMSDGHDTSLIQRDTKLREIIWDYKHYIHFSSVLRGIASPGGN